MPDLTIRIKKKTDGNAALSCTRADGTTTWQRQEGSSGAFFPLHDLTHYSVETVLGLDQAFYGLVAHGWDISSFEAPGARARIPEDALLAEVIVGFFDVERATGVVGSADDFNWKIRTYFENANGPVPAFTMTDEALERIRVRGAANCSRSGVRSRRGYDGASVSHQTHVGSAVFRTNPTTLGQLVGSRATASVGHGRHRNGRVTASGKETTIGA